MTKPFYQNPILNSPYLAPTRHHALSEDGQPLENPPIEGRRRSKYVTPVPRARKVKKGDREQQDFGFDRAADGQAYNPTPIINEIRGHLEIWRSLPNPNDWGVTPTTQRLLQHWRHHDFEGAKPFFCQVEAVEAAIWLTEVARGRRQYAHIFRHLEEANANANPELFRLSLKLATGAGKTTVMAMLIAWQAINASRQPNSSLFSKGFLLIAPGITIKDRLRVLNPADGENYYQTRELVPPELMMDLGKAKIVITNYHAFQRREKLDTNKTGRAVLSGWRNEELVTKETEGEMLQRACGELLSLKNIVVINDEAHHCYRERPPTEEELALKGEEKEEAEKNNQAARLWISGIEALKRKVGVRAVYDLSATPFFLRGSGYEEGTLFPWVVSDFSLVDAIECGIVKLPRVPVSDNAVNAETPVFRNLWDYIGKDMPKKGKGKAGELDPLQLPAKLQTALYALYSHYEKEYEAWERAAIGVPPVFIVVCNNTSSSNLVYEWISGWDRDVESQRQNIHRGHLKLFSNFDQYGNQLPRMNTLLIDSQQVDSGEALDENFRKIAAAEIELFRQEKAAREGAAEAANISDSDLLREVMNTVGRKGRLGERIRCVVSVSMLTEGWDANTVTHILGVRAFGTQLLCEQVIGRGLRRQSYEINPETGLFDTEYADILGIPFDFATEPQDVVRKPPKPVTRVFAVRERERLSIRFPRVAGYRIDLPDDRISATFTEDSRLELTPELVGPCTARLEGLVGEGHDISPDALDDMRPNTVAVHLTKKLVERYFRDPDQPPPYHLYNQIQPITRRWIRDCLTMTGGTKAGMLTYAELADIAAGLIYKAIVHEAGAGGEPVVKAMLDPYNPNGNTSHVSFITTKINLWTTAADKSHVNYVVCDSAWEGEFARVVEAHPSTLAYVKNQALGFEVPYRDGSTNRKYLPDFIVLLDDGNGPDDPLQLVIEIKGFKDLNAQIKAETMRAFWVPGVNNLRNFGRWAFAEFRDAFALEEEWVNLMKTLVNTRRPVAGDSPLKTD
ncbi:MULTISPECIES: DEAD/DEAH box helicase family protein [Mesorhizobium]|uniref:BPTD_3080 family restriction endonuclease n=1 Tax=Mesorhizobium TaxID=68287 RepID=UPI0003CF2FFE|nr:MULTISPECIES: DEAD/DEAH box helicase family protein [Mesorhizobium]ESY66202.1 restriction endonuclease [Mesorhizobium sp. LNHC232B00]WJI38624.1 DEAD/DEAH box helicase family protein [Mesorhizobium opportunistum]